MKNRTSGFEARSLFSVTIKEWWLYFHSATEHVRHIRPDFKCKYSAMEVMLVGPVTFLNHHIPVGTVTRASSNERVCKLNPSHLRRDENQ